MPITWSPTNASALPDETVDLVISKNVGFIYTQVTTEVVTSVQANWNIGSEVMSTWLTLTPSFTSTSGNVNISGTVPIDLFDQYSITYVNKGESDKTQAPIITNGLPPVPDFKEVYNINVDNRTRINASYTVLVYIDNNPVPTYSYSYNFDILQTYSNIKTWTDNYFSTRY